MAKTVGVLQINLTAGTAQFVQDMNKAGASVRNFGSQGSSAVREFQGHTVPAMAASSAAIRTLEGSLPIRAVERFLTSVLPLGPALVAAFPVVGAIAFIGILTKMGEELYKFYRSIADAPEKIGGAFRELGAPLRATNDELRVSNDRLTNDIAKLEGRHQNTLKLALDEARVAADKLADSLDKDLKSLHKILDEQNVSVWRRILGESGTKDITKEVGGQTGFGGFRGQIADINEQGYRQIAAATTAKEKDAAQTELNTKLLKAYDEEIEKVNKSLVESQNLAKPRTIQGRGAEHAGEVYQAPGQDTTARQELLKGVRRQLEQEQQEITLRSTNTDLTGKKESLEAANANANQERPFQDKIKALNAELASLKLKLDASGLTETEKLIAKAEGEALKAITEVNKALERRHTQLSQLQKDAIRSLESQKVTTEAEEQWQTKLNGTILKIHDQVESYKLLTEAIGKNFEIQQKAQVEIKVMGAVGVEQYNDPKWMAEHQPEVQKYRTAFTQEIQTQHIQQTTQSTDKLSDQIDLEKSLAAVQKDGAEAVRLVALAYKLKAIASLYGTEVAHEQIKAEIDLYNATRANQSAANISKINEQITATQRLIGAETQGAEAVRQAQLANKYAAMEKDKVPKEEIDRTKTEDTLKRQQEITTEALKTGIAFKNQIESITEQIDMLEKIKNEQGDSEEIEISLLDLENRRIRVLSEQVQIFGSARDGMRAFFAEMSTQTQSAARMIHDTLGHAFESLNDTLAKVMTGQKVSWANFFTQLGERITKLSLQNLEANIAARVFGTISASAGQPRQPGQSGQSKQPDATSKIGGIFGTIFGAKGLSRDGSSPARALYVSIVGPGGTAPSASGPSVLKTDSDGRPTLMRGDQGAAETETSESETKSDTLRIHEPGEAKEAASGPEPWSERPPVPLSFPGAGGLGGILGSVSGIIRIFQKVLTLPGAQSTGPISRFTSNRDGDTTASALYVTPIAPLSTVGQPTIASQGTAGGFGIPDGSKGNPFYVFVENFPKENFLQSFGKVLSSGASMGVGIGRGLGKLAEGGRPVVGKPSIVGEKGPELFVPDHAGTIIPNHQVQSFMSSRSDSASKDKSTARHSSFAGFFAKGGTTETNKFHVVGEKGPELFVPTAPGKIVPNHEVNNFLASRNSNASSTSKQFAGFYAEGGTAHPGKVHVVGEKGRELFVSNRSESNTANKTSSHRISAISSFLEATTSNAYSDEGDSVSFGGYREMGGNVSADQAYIVGEAGPEVLTKASGRILSHADSRTALGGPRDHYNVSVDARGTDPVQSERRVYRAMLAAHRASVSSAVQASVEMSKRTPPRRA